MALSTLSHIATLAAENPIQIASASLNNYSILNKIDSVALAQASSQLQQVLAHLR